MKLYYHQTDGGAEYYCLDNVANTHEGELFKDCTDEGEVSTWVLRTDGNEFEINIDRLKENNIKLVLRG